MKLLFKASFLITILTMTFHTSEVIATTITKTIPTSSAFKSVQERNAYALGMSLGRYMKNLLDEQKTIGINLDKVQLLTEIQEAFNTTSKMTDAEVEETIRQFEVEVKEAVEKNER